ncbi:S26 family signal peptidase [Halovivax cerinus]|uniref:S26 family signal peptidase n=1 Tax=Halovivax cerinus TaxID=1487865 RepID=A0ABD5NSE6_9EURY|nr:S26 family signal peptidase [Halovivax cerinus]
MSDRGSDSTPNESDRTDERTDEPDRERTDDPPVGTDGPTVRTNGASDAPLPGSESGSRSQTPPAPEPSGRLNAASVSIEDDGLVRWFLRADSGAVVYARDIVSSVGLVMLIALVLFGVSGVWPPLVAVESGSMEPNMQTGDMIFVVEDERLVGDGAIEDTGIVTQGVAGETGHEKFNRPGDVIIFRPGGSDYATPVIHRASFWVERGENWVQTKADPQYVNGASCSDLPNCPAPYAGFVTKGDANRGYDQVPGYGAKRHDVVKPSWVEGKAAYRIPLLGNIRLWFDELFANGHAPVELTPLAAVGVSGMVHSRRAS